MATRKPVPERDRKRAMELLGMLSKDPSNRWVQRHAKRLHDQMNKPMEVILKKVPGDTIMEQAAAIGISRQAFYAWRNGISRPNMTQAKKLAKMTGFTVEQIRGREVYTPPRMTEVVRKPKRKRKPKPAAPTEANAA
jgi:DNA-binding XRE family transcriptional regulator